MVRICALLMALLYIPLLNSGIIYAKELSGYEILSQVQQEKRVVLQKGKSFESQVISANATYVIYDKYELSSKVFVMPKNCVLVFSGGKLSNGKIDLNDAQVIASDKLAFDNVEIVNSTSNQRVNASWFGFSPLGASNSSILQMIVDKFAYVYISPGEYKMNSCVHIKRESKVVDIACEKSEQGRVPTNLVFAASDGFLIEKRLILTGLSVSGKQGRWDDKNKVFVNGFTGFDLRRACVMSFMNIRGFAVGIETSYGESTSGRYERIVFEKCGNYGFRFVSDQANNASNNANLIQDCYFVNIGKDGLVPGTKSTGKTSGIGLYVKGGSGNTIIHNVFEYCSGIGLFIDCPTSTSVMRGCYISGNYFEYNKFANLYVDINTNNPSLVKNFICQGNSYSDSNLALAPDSSPNRTCSILDLYGLVYSGNFVLENVDRNVNQNICGSRLLTLDLLKVYNSVWDFYDAKNQSVVLQYGKTATDAQFLRTENNKGLYKLEVNTKYSGNSDTRLLSLRLKVGSETVDTNCSIPRKKQFDDYIFSQIINVPEDATTVKVEGIYISSSQRGDIMEIKSIRLVPVQSLTSAERKALSVIPGFSIYDSTLKKMVLYNGKNWVNLDGTALK